MENRGLLSIQKNTKAMGGEELRSYTTAPLSEYIGSHIYKMLGIPDHETELGTKNNKLVVACKDFRGDDERLLEMRSLKNTGSSYLNDELENISSSSTGDAVDLDELLLHLYKNPFIKDIPGVIERFWDQVIIDIYINNSDRNNGNWGVLRSKRHPDVLAPVYDNGNSFHNKYSIEKVRNEMQNIEKIKTKLVGITSTTYESSGHHISPKKILSFDDSILKEEIKRVTPIINSKEKDINRFIDGIPEQYMDIPIVSPIEKEFYKLCLHTRLEEFIEPVYKQLENVKTLNEKIAGYEDKMHETGMEQRIKGRNDECR